MDTYIKCKKCRHKIIEIEKMVTEHGNEIVCNGTQTNSKQKMFIPESCYPTWILESIKEKNWSKGKLHCPTCKNKLGSFDFVSSGKCFCGQYCVPPVVLISSKVDYPSINVNVRLSS